MQDEDSVELNTSPKSVFHLSPSLSHSIRGETGQSHTKKDNNSVKYMEKNISLSDDEESQALNSHVMQFETGMTPAFYITPPTFINTLSKIRLPPNFKKK